LSVSVVIIIVFNRSLNHWPILDLFVQGAIFRFSTFSVPTTSVCKKLMPDHSDVTGFWRLGYKWEGYGVQTIKINCVYFVCKEATGSKDSMILANSENSQVHSW